MLIYCMRFTSHKAEQMRLRAHYKKLALSGKLRGLSIEALRSIVGPDCAYHLYWAAGPATRHDAPEAEAQQEIGKEDLR